MYAWFGSNDGTTHSIYWRMEVEILNSPELLFCRSGKIVDRRVGIWILIDLTVLGT